MSSRGSERRRVAFWSDPWILGGLSTFIAFRILYFFLVASTAPLLGDEWFYYPRASLVGTIAHDILSGDVASGLALVDQLVDRGWFLPGMSIVLAPLRAVTDSLLLARVYIGVLNGALFLLCVRRLAGMFGIVPARIALALVAVFPYHAAFSFRFWGDLLAGHGVLYLLLLLADTQQQIRRNAKADLSRLVVIGTTIVALIYVRASLTLLMPATLLFLFLFHLERCAVLQALRRSVAAGVVIVTLVALGLAPWSYGVSKKFGGLFITTTSLDLNIIYAFGPNTWKPHIVAGQNPWVFIHDLTAEKAATTGRTYGAALREWRSEVISGLTPRDYAAAVRTNLRLFFINDRDFLERFASPEFETRGKARELDFFNQSVIVLNSVLWKAGLVYEELNERERAVDFIKRAIEIGYPRDALLESRALATLRTDSRFGIALQP